MHVRCLSIISNVLRSLLVFSAFIASITMSTQAETFVDTRGSPSAGAPFARLLLTSSGFINQAANEEFTRLLHDAAAAAGNGTRKVVYIVDAAVMERGNAEQDVERMRQRLTALGASEVVGLQLAHTPAAEVAHQLASAACVYVEMGNTYFVAFHVRRTQADVAIQQLVDRGGLFCGASAGAILAGATLKVCEWKAWDDPGHGQSWDLRNLPTGLDGLNLLKDGMSVFPHYSGQWQARAVEMAPQHQETVVILDEGSVYVQEPSGYRILGNNYNA